MANHSFLIEAYYNGTWNDITGDITEGSLKFSRGLTEVGEVKPASLSWVFEDTADKWRPGNPLSVVYGKAGRAMPVRVNIDSDPRCAGEALSFEPDQTEDFTVGPPVKGRRWVDFGAAGVLARINSWDEPVRSPMYRTISTLSNILGHWPMEEGREATQLSNTVNAGSTGLAQLVEFDNADAPDGAVAAVQLIELGSRVGGSFTLASSTAGWQFAWSSRLAAMPSSLTYLQMFSWRTSNGSRWTVDVNQDSYRMRVTDAGGTVVEENIVLHTGSGEPNQWITYRMKATASGGTVSCEFAWYAQGQTTPYGTTGTFSGTLGSLVSWSANGNAWMQDALLSHVYGVTTGTDDLLSYAARRAFDGYVGERAADRVSRLLLDENITFILNGSASDTMPMGRQPSEPLSKILKECAATERGLIFDSATGQAVEMRTRISLLHQSAAVLAWPTGIAKPFRERYDDVGITNYVTASQRDGGEAVAIQATGPMSVQNVPDGIGPKKTGLDVNVSDETRLPDLAGWELAQGTLEGPRFPSLTVDLDAAPSLTTAVNGIDIGDRVAVTGLREYTIDLIVIGISEAPRQKRRQVIFTCIPADVFWQAGIYDNSARRISSASTTLAAGVTSSATSMVFRTVDLLDTWSTTETPYDVLLAGERVTVTAMGAVSGSGPYDQPATVTRAVNGIAKAQTAGTPVDNYIPARWVL